ncbi:NHL repeat-containing protein [Halomonas cerina]|uniref:DNA-binding beta-propeller fold protein YncE n=1 Tax=Halomonas cerina TaxID=447424 RepID=A0A839V2E6_9GAMM|nr:NHL repeat-containing protein [Halomonas cerina]MBB3189522.1 DNA-binding beta-propeller fold protein YncE [Halomonas cerina]
MTAKRFLKMGAIVTGLVVVAAIASYAAFVPREKESGYEFVGAWGSQGSEPGQFDDPTGVAVTANEVFVADARNGRIQVFDHEGQFKRAFGTPGDAPGKLGRPMNLTIHKGKLYVPEYMNDRIQMFSLAGEPLDIIGGPGQGPGEFSAPDGVAVAESGDLFVADFYNQRVQRLRADGEFVRQWGTTGETGRRAGMFTYPTDVALAADETLYVADGYGNRVQAFDAAGEFLRKWGGPFAIGIYGPFNGWLTTVTGIAIGPDERVFAADFYNDRIQIFTAEGTFLNTFGETGDGPGQFNHAIALDIAPDGTIFVADFQNNRIEKWRPIQ